MSVQTVPRDDPDPPPARRRHRGRGAEGRPDRHRRSPLAAWVLAGALAGTAFVVLLVATVAAVAYLAFRGT